MDFSHLIDKSITVHFAGGREIFGILKGFDQVSNLVLDNVWEIFRDVDDHRKEISRRELGLIIVRGPNVKFCLIFI
jgi:U6 snRNA-associated Sm-like protein LSm7